MHLFNYVSKNLGSIVVPLIMDSLDKPMLHGVACMVVYCRAAWAAFDAIVRRQYLWHKAKPANIQEEAADQQEDGIGS
jgi:hypothetical protein